MTSALRVLGGLLAGFLLGLLLARVPASTAQGVLAVLTPIGTLFVSLIRMTVLPLVTSLLVASLAATASSQGIGRLGSRALGISALLLTIAAVGSGLVASRVLARTPIDAVAARSLVPASASPVSAQASPTVAGWLVDLVPTNVAKAAVDGAMLPLIVFSVFFGLTLAHIDERRREPVLRVAEGVAETMQRMVARILSLAPLGVFALAVPLAARLGVAAAGAVITYVVLVVTLTVVAVVLLIYPSGIIGGRMRLGAFAAYCAPGQAIAFAARSSLAALPAMIESAEAVPLSSAARTVVLPLAATVYHFGAAVAQTVGVVFLAHLYGVPLGAGDMVSVVVAVVLASYAVPGIPGGSIVAMAPALTVAHLPLDGLAILLAVDTIPDMFRTTANVTGSLALAAMLGGAQTASDSTEGAA